MAVAEAGATLGGIVVRDEVIVGVAESTEGWLGTSCTLQAAIPKNNISPKGSNQPFFNRL